MKYKQCLKENKFSINHFVYVRYTIFHFKICTYMYVCIHDAIFWKLLFVLLYLKQMFFLLKCSKFISEMKRKLTEEVKLNSNLI